MGLKEVALVSLFISVCVGSCSFLCNLNYRWLEIDPIALLLAGVLELPCSLIKPLAQRLTMFETVQVAADSCLSIHGHCCELPRRCLVVAVQRTTVSTGLARVETSQVIHSWPELTPFFDILVL